MYHSSLPLIFPILVIKIILKIPYSNQIILIMPTFKAVKLLAIIPLILFYISAGATNYYLSNAGNDNNSGTDASSSWRTLAKLNSFSNLNPGDNVFFKRGDTFYGTITVSTSGMSGSPITYGAYGSGAKPIITGFSNVTSWTNLGGNIWESTNAVSSLPYTNIVVINGMSTQMGRYPNTGYLTYQSHVGNTSITSSSLAGSLNWTGAEVVMKKAKWAIERSTINNQSGNTISYSTPGVYTPQDTYGFFIQNDSRTLDQQNEWYYNPSTKKLRIYSISSPTNVQVTTTERLVNAEWTVGSGNYVTFDNLSLIGANSAGLYITYKSNVSVTNCDVSFTGEEGIYGEGCVNLTLENNNINYTNGTAITLTSTCPNASIRYNTIKGAGMFPGMTKSFVYDGIFISADNTLVQYNSIDSSGNDGISFNGNYTKIKNNLVNHSLLLLDDGGGIYTDGKMSAVGREIVGNIVLNTIGNPDGSYALNVIIAHGIYLDDDNSFVTVTGNSVSGSRGSGIFIHNSTDLVINGNTSYDNGFQDNFLKGSLMFQYDPRRPIRNVQLNNNIFFAKTATQLAFFSYAGAPDPNDIKLFGTADNNYYARPISDNNLILIGGDALTWPGNYYNIDGWKAYSGMDIHSMGSPKAVSSTDDLRFEYNGFSSNKTISLGATYIDVKGNSYNGTITLAPYTSAVLIKNGASTINQPPVAIAGNDITLNLPTNNATLTGSGTSPTGTIVAYSWTQLSGPTATIVAPNSAISALTGLTSGTYQFQLTVTDNNGSSARATVNIYVNSPSQGNLLPAVYPSNTINGLDYKYYEADNYSKIPDFTSLQAVKTGNSSTFDISLANRSTAFSFLFSGYINVPTDGQYTFYTTSDDGSNLYIDNVQVVNNDGLHGALEQTGTIGLKAGMHAISVGFFQQSGDDILSVSYSSATIAKQVIPTSTLYRVSQGVSQGNLLPAVFPSNTVNGLDYKYYEGNYTYIPAFSSLTPVKTGSTSSFDISISNRSTLYGFNFTGYINVPSDGQYTFFTTSDDGSNLFIDNVQVVNNDGLHGAVEQAGTIGLKAGMHAISVNYFQQGAGNVLSISYSSTAIAKQVIPTSALYRVSQGNLLPAVYPSNPVNGLDYKYYEGNYTYLPSFNSLSPVKTGTTSSPDISLSNRSTLYGFSFTGYVNVPSDGQYTFYTTSDDGSNLFIDNVLVVNNDGLHGALEQSGTIGLQAGMHAISIGYFQQGGGNVLTVSYSSPAMAKQVIPASAFYRNLVSGTGSIVSRISSMSNSVDVNGDKIDSLKTSASVQSAEADLKTGLTAYPNPFSNHLEISINGSNVAGEFKLMLLDAVGKIVWTKIVSNYSTTYHETVNTSSLPSGIYFLNLIEKNKSSVITLIKQH